MRIQDIIWDYFLTEEFKLNKAISLVGYEELNDALNIALEQSKVVSEQLLECQADNVSLREKLSQNEEENSIEEEWNNKRPKTQWRYPGRLHPETGERVFVDPRVFFQYDEDLKTYLGTNDEIASKCLNWVERNVTYTTDSKGKGEYWQFAHETDQRRRGDCEDGAILMVNMMLMSGVPYYRIRLNAGEVQGGGHAYVTYLSEENNQWYVLDWCYWYDESKDLSKLWKDAEKYFAIWGSWNTKYIFGDLPKEVMEVIENEEEDRETLLEK